MDTNGNSIWILPISSGIQDPQVKKVIPSPDGGTFILGSDLSTIGGFMDWLLIKVSYSGQLEWTRRFSGGPSWYCEGNNIEPLRNGNFLLSGMAENRIWSVEVDAEGNEINNNNFWISTVNFLGFDAVVRQTSYRSFAVSGAFESNPKRTFFGKFDSLRNKIWGGENSVRFTSIKASTRDGQLLVLDGRAIVNDSLFFSIFNPDSSLSWRLGLPRTGLSSRNVDINDIAFDGLGNILLCGSAKQ